MPTGKIFVLDGPSGCGKSTIVSRLLAHPELDLRFCRRVTTRPPRALEEEDYDFVSQDELDAMERAGQLASFRHFKFGMSYGLPRLAVDAAAAQGDVLALTDLGTVDQVKATWPYCVAILIIAPLDDLKSRLESRGSNTAEQIEERLDNARRAFDLVPHYDYVVSNPQGQLDRTVARLAWILRSPV